MSASAAASVLPTDLWIAPLTGGVLALVGAVLAIGRVGGWGNWKAPVATTSAWDFQDSWVTNVTAVGGAITAVFSATALASFLGNTNADAFTLLSLLFGGATVLGPVIYGACGLSPTAAAATPSGSKGGAILAGAVTLFAVFGLLADVGQLISYTTVRTTDQVVVFVGLAAAALFLMIYAIRSIEFMVNPPAQAGGAGAGVAAAKSLMSPASRISGTL